MFGTLFLLSAVMFLPGCASASEPSPVAGGDVAVLPFTVDHEEVGAKTDASAHFGTAAPAPDGGLAVAVFAGGCFWCMEKPFDHLVGVVSTTSGYVGGTTPAPTYAEVSAHRTDYAEGLRVIYDPARVSYARLLDVFWHNVDPTQKDGQFCDHGHQYRTGVYSAVPAERARAETDRVALKARLGSDIATEVMPLTDFWPAEDYHQDFYEKSPGRYTSYRTGCGRDRRLQELWGPAAGVGEGPEWLSGPTPSGGG